MMTEFSPSDTIIEHLRDADQRRLRIVSWQINDVAWAIILRHEYCFMFDGEAPREFMGIPFCRLEGDPALPSIEPTYETYGGKLLIHDYDGPILHGIDHNRFLATQSQNSDSSEVRTPPATAI